MKPFQFDQDSVWLAEGCTNPAAIRDAMRFIFADIANFPERVDASIVIKPNLNNDLSALTGNSTDLRILAELIKIIKQRGYENIAIVDGPNVGVYRKGIDVFGRLGVRQLAKYFDVALVDLNAAPFVEVEVNTGTIRVAELCLQADYLINVPKIKTHAESGISLAMKNLMGCVIGTDTRIMHLDLAANLVRLNEIVRPDLIIVDGLIGMEGNGPGDGNPKRMDMILAGSNPFLLDLFAAHLVGLDSRNIPYLDIAQQRGHIRIDDVNHLPEIFPLVVLKPPQQRSLATRFLEHRYLTKVRDLTRFVHGSEMVRKLLYRLGIMQDVYETAEANIESLMVDRDLCNECGKCFDVCPTELPITDEGFDFYASQDCLGCLYCALICPQQAIQITGELGYLKAHLERYGEAMMNLLTNIAKD